MSKNPLINALLAFIYVIFVASIMYLGTIYRVGNNSIIAPIALISLFTFSAAMMGYLFLYQPFLLYFDGQKKQALDIFLKTLFIFGGLTAVLFIWLFFSAIS